MIFVAIVLTLAYVFMGCATWAFACDFQWERFTKCDDYGLFGMVVVVALWPWIIWRTITGEL